MLQRLENPPRRVSPYWRSRGFFWRACVPRRKAGFCFACIIAIGAVAHFAVAAPIARVLGLFWAAARLADSECEKFCAVDPTTIGRLQAAL
jgi:hypothetical protein